jgi:hypothetical protein
MTLPIQSTRTVVGPVSQLSVTLTILLASNIEMKDYPECFAIRMGNEVLVFAYSDYEDGRMAHPRARWSTSLVVGIEHFGAHEEHAEWHNAHKPPQPAQRPQTPAQRHPAGPDYPQVITELKPPGVILSGPVAPNVQKQIEETQAMDPVEDLGPLPTEDILGTSTGASVSPAKDPESSSPSEKIEQSEFWQPDEEEDGWKPRGRPSQHKPAQPRRSPRGATKRAVRGAGMALLLGFALLGFNPNL